MKGDSMGRWRVIAFVVVMALRRVRLAAVSEVRLATWNLEWFFDHDLLEDPSVIGRNHATSTAALFQECGAAVAAIATLRLPIFPLREVEHAVVVQHLADRLQNFHGLRYTVAFREGTIPIPGKIWLSWFRRGRFHIATALLCGL
jgi:hypothetical protein